MRCVREVTKGLLVDADTLSTMGYLSYYEDRPEIDVATIPWHKRDPRSIDEHLVLPVSRWGRVLYWTALPFVILLWVAVLVATSHY